MPATFSLAALKAEILGDPSSLGYAPLVDAGTDTLLADALNDRTRTAQGGAPLFAVTAPVPLATYMRWLGATGVRAKLQDGASSPDPAVRSLFLTALDLILTPHASTLDVSDPHVVQLMQAMVVTGVVSVDDMQGMIDLATVPASRAEALWGPGASVSADQVGYALRW